MVRFKATIQKFQKQGEKTGWTYISIPQKMAEQINPGVKKSYRVKGRLDAYVFDGISLLPMGEGDFIIPLKADIRKKLGKRAGETLMAELELQQKAYEIDADFMACLEDEPAALRFFETLPNGHRNYFSKWIESAKTEPTRAERIALAVNALAKKWGYAEMIRAQKKD